MSSKECRFGKWWNDEDDDDEEEEKEEEEEEEELVRTKGFGIDMKLNGCPECLEQGTNFQVFSIYLIFIE